MAYVFICPECKGVFKHPTNDAHSCPDCQVQLLATDISDVEWAKLSPQEKNNIKNTLRTAGFKKQQEQKKEMDAKLASILISSGFSFDGYRIVKYSGYISGDDAVEIPRSGFLFTTNNSQNLTDALVKIRVQALRELKQAAYDLGCNAVIGVDFDYITLEPEHGSGLYNGVPGAGTVYEPYIICVTANGNAVVIEKE